MLFSKAFGGDFSIGLSTSTFPAEERIKETSLGFIYRRDYFISGAHNRHTKKNWLRGIHDRAHHNAGNVIEHEETFFSNE